MKLNKLKIIKYLLIVSVVLLLGNAALDMFFIKPPVIEHLTTENLNKRFEIILKEFGIHDDWVSKKRISAEKTDSLKFIYKVKVPADLPITILLNQVITELNGLPLSITAREKNVNGLTRMNIFHGNSLMLAADIDLNMEIARKVASIGFIISDVEELSADDFEKLMSFPEFFAVMLHPSQKSKEYKKSVIEHGKEYILVINDDMDEIEYKMEEDYGRIRLKTSVRTIISDFSDTRLFAIDEKSALYRSSLSNFLNTEFQKRKLELTPLGKFVWLTGRDEEDLNNQFRSISRNLKPGESRIFVLKAEDFYNLGQEIELFRKQGYKFILPSSVNFGI